MWVLQLYLQIVWHCCHGNSNGNNKVPPLVFFFLLLWPCFCGTPARLLSTKWQHSGSRKIQNEKNVQSTFCSREMARKPITNCERSTAAQKQIATKELLFWTKFFRVWKNLVDAENGFGRNYENTGKSRCLRGKGNKHLHAFAFGVCLLVPYIAGWADSGFLSNISNWFFGRRPSLPCWKLAQKIAGFMCFKQNSAPVTRTCPFLARKKEHVFRCVHCVPNCHYLSSHHGPECILLEQKWVRFHFSRILFLNWPFEQIYTSLFGRALQPHWTTCFATLRCSFVCLPVCLSIYLSHGCTPNCGCSKARHNANKHSGFLCCFFDHSGATSQLNDIPSWGILCVRTQCVHSGRAKSRQPSLPTQSHKCALSKRVSSEWFLEDGSMFLFSLFGGRKTGVNASPWPWPKKNFFYMKMSNFLTPQFSLLVWYKCTRNSVGSAGTNSHLARDANFFCCAEFLGRASLQVGWPYGVEKIRVIVVLVTGDPHPDLRPHPHPDLTLSPCQEHPCLFDGFSGARMGLKFCVQHCLCWTFWKQNNCFEVWEWARKSAIKAQKIRIFPQDKTETWADVENDCQKKQKRTFLCTQVISGWICIRVPFRCNHCQDDFKADIALLWSFVWFISHMVSLGHLSKDLS